LLLQTGYFDSKFSGNAIFEDTDLCFRFRKLGYKIIFDPKAELIHLAHPRGGCETRSLSQTEYYYHFLRNKTLFFLKNMKRFYLPCFYGTVFLRALITGLLKDRSIKNFFKLAITAPLAGLAAYMRDQYL
jgi:GT2 family glycosyltransferase